MKKTKLILSSIAFALTVLVFVQACKKDNQTDISGTYKIELQESINILKNGTAISAKLISVEDSRCPINASCITSGYILIKLNFIDNQGEQSFEVCSENCLDKVARPKSIRLNGVSYSIKIEDLTPYPDFSKPTTVKQKVTIVIAKI